MDRLHRASSEVTEALENYRSSCSRLSSVIESLKAEVQSNKELQFNMGNSQKLKFMLSDLTDNYSADETLISVRKMAIELKKLILSREYKNDPFTKKAPVPVEEADRVMKERDSNFGVSIDKVKAHNSLNMLTFVQIIDKLRDMTSTDSLDDNLDLVKRTINVLLYLKACPVSEKILKQSEAGKLLTKIKKSTINLALKENSKKVIEAWKASINRQKTKQNEKNSPQKSSNKFARKVAISKKKKDVAVGQNSLIRKRENPVQKRKLQERERRLSDEEWERRFREKARAGYNTVQYEEKYSRRIGKQEDIDARADST